MKDHFFLFYFETTRRCNVHCPYCMARLPKPPTQKELSTEEVKRFVLDEIIRFTSRAAVAFSGGEFLLREDAEELLGYAACKGLMCMINTNGRMIAEDPELAQRLYQITSGNLMLVFSLNSIKEEHHQWSRNDKLTTVFRAMKICQKFTVPYFTLVTISKHNLDSLAETFKYLRLKRIPVLRAPFVPRGDGANFPQLGFTHQEMQEIIHPVLRSNHLAYVSFTPFFASPELIGEEWQKHGVTIGQLGCQAGRGFIGISSEGNVAPCVQLLDSSAEIGNVRQKPLAQLLNTSPVIAALSTRERLEGKCGRCRYRVTCGGCRALAFYRYNNIMAEDPTCFFEPQSAQERSPWEDLQNKNLLKFLDFIRLTSPWNRMFVQTDHTQPTTL